MTRVMTMKASDIYVGQRIHNARGIMGCATVIGKCAWCENDAYEVRLDSGPYVGMHNNGLFCARVADWEPVDVVDVEPNNQEKIMAYKYYRLVKDTPRLLSGAILRSDGDAYKPISDVWDTHDDDPNSEAGYRGWVVEHSPEWYERVYEVSAFGKLKYLTKDAARKVSDQLFKQGTQDK